jgi:hypothetical protein
MKRKVAFVLAGTPAAPAMPSPGMPGSVRAGP